MCKRRRKYSPFIGYAHFFQILVKSVKSSVSCGLPLVVYCLTESSTARSLLKKKKRKEKLKRTQTHNVGNSPTSTMRNQTRWGVSTSATLCGRRPPWTWITRTASAPPSSKPFAKSPDRSGPTLKPPTSLQPRARPRARPRAGLEAPRRRCWLTPGRRSSWACPTTPWTGQSKGWDAARPRVRVWSRTRRATAP